MFTQQDVDNEIEPEMSEEPCTAEDFPPPIPDAPVTLAISGSPEAQAALFSAIATAQSDMKDPGKNSTGRIGKGGAETFRYADLQNVLESVRPPLARAGVAIIQPVHGYRGRSTLSTILAGHGAVLRADISLPSYGADEIKDFGAYLTYLRRYAVMSVVAVAGDTDLDETGADGFRQRKAAPTRTPPSPRQQNAAPSSEPAPKPAPEKPKDPKPADAPPKRAQSEPPPPPAPEEPASAPEPPTREVLESIKKVASKLAPGGQQSGVPVINRHSQDACGFDAITPNPETKRLGWNPSLTQADCLAILDAMNETLNAL